jgi:hypothetical protein
MPQKKKKTLPNQNRTPAIVNPGVLVSATIKNTCKKQTHLSSHVSVSRYFYLIALSAEKAWDAWNLGSNDHTKHPDHGVL